MKKLLILLLAGILLAGSAFSQVHQTKYGIINQNNAWTGTNTFGKIYAGSGVITNLTTISATNYSVTFTNIISPFGQITNLWVQYLTISNPFDASMATNLQWGSISGAPSFYLASNPSNWISLAQAAALTNALYPSSNPSNWVTWTITNGLYPASNPSNWITLVQAAPLTNGLYPASNPSNWVTALVTNGLYPDSNPSNWITLSQAAPLTNGLYPASNPSNWVTWTITNGLYPASNPSNWTTAAVTNGLYPDSNPSNWITLAQAAPLTNSLYPASNPSNWVTASVTNGLATPAVTNGLYPASNPSNWVTASVTNGLYPNSNPSNWITLAQAAPLTNALQVTNAALASIFINDGGSLTNLNASNLASGTVPTARYGSEVVLSNLNNILTGSNYITGWSFLSNANPHVSFAWTNGGRRDIEWDGTNITMVDSSDVAVIQTNSQGALLNKASADLLYGTAAFGTPVSYSPGFFQVNKGTNWQTFAYGTVPSNKTLYIEYVDITVSNNNALPPNVSIQIYNVTAAATVMTLTSKGGFITNLSIPGTNIWYARLINNQPTGVTGTNFYGSVTVSGRIK